MKSLLAINKGVYYLFLLYKFISKRPIRHPGIYTVLVPSNKTPTYYNNPPGISDVLCPQTGLDT
jgi:hypothetical protein